MAPPTCVSPPNPGKPFVSPQGSMKVCVGSRQPCSCLDVVLPSCVWSSSYPCYSVPPLTNFSSKNVSAFLVTWPKNSSGLETFFWRERAETKWFIVSVSKLIYVNYYQNALARRYPVGFYLGLCVRSWHVAEQHYKRMSNTQID